MMLLGGELKRRERLSARLGDVLSYLYLGSAALKRYHDLNSPSHLQPLLRWAMEESLGQAEKALDRLLDNFPSRVLGCALRLVVFPFGRRHTGPSDELDAEIAALIGRAAGDPALEALLAGCYRPTDPEDPVGALQHASHLLADSAEIHKKLRHALKNGEFTANPGESLIDAALRSGTPDTAQAEKLREGEAARRKVIDVDAFTKEELLPSAGKVR